MAERIRNCRQQGSIEMHRQTVRDFLSGERERKRSREFEGITTGVHGSFAMPSKSSLESSDFPRAFTCKYLLPMDGSRVNIARADYPRVTSLSSLIIDFSPWSRPGRVPRLFDESPDSFSPSGFIDARGLSALLMALS